LWWGWWCQNLGKKKVGQGGDFHFKKRNLSRILGPGQLRGLRGEPKRITRGRKKKTAEREKSISVGWFKRWGNEQQPYTPEIIESRPGRDRNNLFLIPKEEHAYLQPEGLKQNKEDETWKSVDGQGG